MTSPRACALRDWHILTDLTVGTWGWPLRRRCKVITCHLHSHWSSTPRMSSLPPEDIALAETLLLLPAQFFTGRLLASLSSPFPSSEAGPLLCRRPMRSPDCSLAWVLLPGACRRTMKCKKPSQRNGRGRGSPFLCVKQHPTSRAQATRVHARRARRSAKHTTCTTAAVAHARSPTAALSLGET